MKKFPIKNAIETKVIRVDYRDFTDFISQQYGNTDYSLTEDFQVVEWYEDYFCVVKRELFNVELNDIDEFKSGKYIDAITQTLLHDLANRNVLPECTLHVVKYEYI